MMNIMLRLVERGEGAFGGSVGSRPLVIDLVNNRFRSNFICPVRLDECRRDI
jgi:hypothetical protein